MEAAEHACAAMNKDAEDFILDAAHTWRTLRFSIMEKSKVMMACFSTADAGYRLDIRADVTIKRCMRTPPTHAELRVPVSNYPQRFKLAKFSGPLFAEEGLPRSLLLAGRADKKNELVERSCLQNLGHV